MTRINSITLGRSLQGSRWHDEIEGTRRDDTLLGRDGHDELEGKRGNDLLDGGWGNDTLDGGRGDDILTGGSGSDRFDFEVGEGRDTITDFQNGADRIEIDDLGAASIQSLINGARQVGNDVVLTLSPTSSITFQDFQLADLDLSDFAGIRQPRPPITPKPERGRDIDGSQAADNLTGGAGNDDIEGRRGNDRLNGADGNDTLDGGRGDDILTGGSGSDRFEFDLGDGRDTITDFQNGMDRIEIDDLGAASIQSLINGARQVGGDVIVTLSADTTITISDFQKSQLDIADFHW
jgi:serralysin